MYLSCVNVNMIICIDRLGVGNNRPKCSNVAPLI